MSTAMSKIAVVAVLVGLGGAISAIGGHRADTAAPPAPATQQAAKAPNMCVIAASFASSPVMAKEIRLAAGCR